MSAERVSIPKPQHNNHTRVCRPRAGRQDMCTKKTNKTHKNNNKKKKKHQKKKKKQTKNKQKNGS